jgi:tetratricopeptide (TPR) repeat protein
MIGIIYSQGGDYKKAEEIYLTGIEAVPDDPELHFNLGIVYDKLDRFEDMISEMRKTIEIDPDHENALNYLGYSFADKGINLDEAISLVERALKIKPDNGAYVDSLGWAYYKKGWIDLAIQHLKRASELMPDDPVIMEHLGDVYIGMNMKVEAREEWLKSLEMNIGNPKLIEKFKEAGFGDPEMEDRLKDKLEEYNKKKLKDTEDLPKGDVPPVQNNMIKLKESHGKLLTSFSV